MGKPKAADVNSIVTALFTSSFEEAKSHIMDLYLSGNVNMVDLVSFILNKVISLSSLNINKGTF